MSYGYDGTMDDSMSMGGGGGGGNFTTPSTFFGQTCAATTTTTPSSGKGWYEDFEIAMSGGGGSDREAAWLAIVEPCFTSCRQEGVEGRRSIFKADYFQAGLVPQIEPLD